MDTSQPRGSNHVPGADDDRGTRARRVEHRDDVPGFSLEVGQTCVPIRQTGATHVVTDHPRERVQLLGQRGDERVLPLQLEAAVETVGSTRRRRGRHPRRGRPCAPVVGKRVPRFRHVRITPSPDRGASDRARPSTRAHRHPRTRGHFRRRVTFTVDDARTSEDAATAPTRAPIVTPMPRPSRRSSRPRRCAPLHGPRVRSRARLV